MSQQIDSHVLAQYRVIKKIGSGAYGHVWKVQDRKTKCLKALKKNFDAFSNPTDAQRVYRQIMFLRQLQHPNIIKLERIIKSNNDMDIYLVFQHMEVDLHALIRESSILEAKHKKYIIYQICRAVYFLHNSDIIHRDLKPSNILINEQCDAKLCDFGLVRLLEEPTGNQMAIMTDYIATRWYRAPELLLGCNSYSKEIDIWSLGCMIGQIFRGKPLFQGTSTIDQLQKILCWTGYPTQHDIAAMKVTLGQGIFQAVQIKRKASKLEMLGSEDKNLLDLISCALKLNPSSRITIEQVFRHPFFKQFYDPKEIQGIQTTKVTLKLHINDNIKLSAKDYLKLISKETQGTSNNLLSTKGIISVTKRVQSSNLTTSYSRQQNSSTKKSRPGSRKKGISLCSKQMSHHRIQRENAKSSKSVAATGTKKDESMDKYRRIASNYSNSTKKSMEVVQKTKNNSSHFFISSVLRLKSEGMLN